MEELLTAAEVSAKWKVTTDQIYRWIKAGLLKARKSPTGTIRLVEEEAEAFWAEKNIPEKA